LQIGCSIIDDDDTCVPLAGVLFQAAETEKHISTMRFFFLTTNISLISSLARASFQIGVRNNGEIINLSCQKHLDSIRITSLLLTKIQSASEIESKNNVLGLKEINIDVSASHLGDGFSLRLFASISRW